jgi:predicted nucleotide-binding protein
MAAGPDSGLQSTAFPQASALVVGIERYGDTGSGWDFPGAARLAARFALWLIRHRICPPERITLMTTYEEAAYENGILDRSLSPKDLVDSLNALGGGLRMVRDARVDKEFTDWITKHGPMESDELFVLFWVGHGFSNRNDLYQKLYLLGSDADGYQLRNVELAQLLHAVGSNAPRADQVGFVDVSRAPIAAGWEKRLSDGVRMVPENAARQYDRHPKSQSIVFAAAHGETTKQAGWRSKAFGELLLGLLEKLPEGSSPKTVFGDELRHIVEELAREQAAPFWVSYGYQHGGEASFFNDSAPDSQTLTSENHRSVTSGRADPRSPNGPIFIVHGRDTLRAESVAHAVSAETGRKTIILRNEPNLGQTLIEKFEKHAAEVSYAIIILTPDDTGSRAGEASTLPRGRQNVIFEMGYFYGFIGRANVSVLIYPGVEKPSDMEGIAYITFDDDGAWKTELFRELRHVGFDVRS